MSQVERGYSNGWKISFQSLESRACFAKFGDLYDTRRSNEQSGWKPLETVLVAYSFDDPLAGAEAVYPAD